MSCRPGLTRVGSSAHPRISAPDAALGSSIVISQPGGRFRRSTVPRRDDGAAHRQAEAVSRSRAGGAGLVAAPSGGERSLQGFRAQSATSVADLHPHGAVITTDDHCHLGPRTGISNGIAAHSARDGQQRGRHGVVGGSREQPPSRTRVRGISSRLTGLRRGGDTDQEEIFTIMRCLPNPSDPALRDHT